MKDIESIIEQLENESGETLTAARNIYGLGGETTETTGDKI